MAIVIMAFKKINNEPKGSWVDIIDTFFVTEWDEPC